MPGTEDIAVRIRGDLVRLGATLGTAESLTGGLISATLTAVPGASAAFRGGIVCYATDTKRDLLGVDPALLAAQGAVHPEVAQAMAKGARRALGATYGLAVTGVAGPEPQDGQPVGTVFAAVSGPGGQMRTAEWLLAGDRSAIREETTRRALMLVTATMTENTSTAELGIRTAKRSRGTNHDLDHVNPPANRQP